MPTVKTPYEHIALDENGVPILAGTNMKVVELIAEKRAYGWSPEELFFQHPYLTLGQIHSALAYYWDHAAQLDQDIERRIEHADQLRQASGPSPLAKRLQPES